MTITYPLAFPTHTDAAALRITRRSVVAVAVSPFTGKQQTQAHQGQWFEAEISLPPMYRADAAPWIAFLMKLNGMEGTFLAGDPSYRASRGTIAGTVLVNGAHSARAKTLALKGMTAGTTLLAGDYIQLGSSSASRLHAVLSDVTADGSGNATLDIWPALRTSYSDSAAVTYNSPVGLWRLATNEMPNDFSPGQIFSGITLPVREAL
jgi:hypothetical protein